MDKYARYPPILVPLWKSQVVVKAPQQNKVGSMAGKTTWHRARPATGEHHQNCHDQVR